MRFLAPKIVLLCAFAASHACAAVVVDADICVYGGTSGGVIAAVQAKRVGKSVALVVFNDHVGGMTSGGLGATDVGNAGTIGGLSGDFYRRISVKYGGSSTAMRFNFEPHVAEEVFNEMLAAENISPRYHQRLAQVVKAGQRIQWIAMEDGTVYRAKMFIDATYEGDLLAMAGVSFTVGRESSATYNESLNGIRASTPAHQFTVNVDPYRVPGNPGSGLLPYIQMGDGGAPGASDNRVQAYNYRLCLTTNAANRLPIPAPPDYDEANYELLARLIEARLAAGNTLNLRSFINIASMPNSKTDINNNGAFSTDFIGMNDEYPTASYARRAELDRAHRNYIQGFIHYLGHGARVPQAIRDETLTYGFCADEYVSNDHWSHQLYVREARRMISDYVMSQQDCEGTRVAPDPVALGSYNMDSHNVQRIVAPNGFVRNEGDVQVGVSPYGISYRSIVPRTGECENLLVAWALSASHIAFGSIRMEPVHMMLGQSAATAAAFCIDDGVAVQGLEYARLAIQFEAQEQIVRWGSNEPGLVVDNADPAGVTIVGSWTASTSTPGYQGTNYLHDGATAKGTRRVVFVPDLPVAGEYDVSVRWTAHPNRSSNVPIDLVAPGGTTTMIFNQQQNGGAWIPLGRASFVAGSSGSVVVRTDGTAEGSYVIADAARWVPVNAAAPQVEVVASRGVAAENGSASGQFTFLRPGTETANPLTIFYSANGTAQPGVDTNALPGNVTIPAGARTAMVTIQAVPDAEVESTETLTVAIQAGAGYSVGARGSAAIRIADLPFDDWRKARFSAAESADSQVSGRAADPDGDGLTNLIEFFYGNDPKVPLLGSPIEVTTSASVITLRFRRARHLGNVTYQVLTATDLAAPVWVPRAPLIENILLHSSDEQTDLVEITIPVGNAEQMFLRLRVVEPAG